MTRKRTPAGMPSCWDSVSQEAWAGEKGGAGQTDRGPAARVRRLSALPSAGRGREGQWP